MLKSPREGVASLEGEAFAGAKVLRVGDDRLSVSGTGAADSGDLCSSDEGYSVDWSSGVCKGGFCSEDPCVGVWR